MEARIERPGLALASQCCDLARLSYAAQIRTGYRLRKVAVGGLEDDRPKKENR